MSSIVGTLAVYTIPLTSLVSTCRLLVNLQHLSAGENNLVEIPAEIGKTGVRNRERERERERGRREREREMCVWVSMGERDHSCINTFCRYFGKSWGAIFERQPEPSIITIWVSTVQEASLDECRRMPTRTTPSSCGRRRTLCYYPGILIGRGGKEKEHMWYRVVT